MTRDKEKDSFAYSWGEKRDDQEGRNSFTTDHQRDGGQQKQRYMLEDVPSVFVLRHNGTNPTVEPSSQLMAEIKFS